MLVSFSAFETGANVAPQANLSNENTSEESKQHSRAQLDELESSGRLGEHSAEKNTNNVLGGFKATINSERPLHLHFELSLIAVPDPNVSEEAKEHARDVLREHGAME